MRQLKARRMYYTSEQREQRMKRIRRKVKISKSDRSKFKLLQGEIHELEESSIQQLPPIQQAYQPGEKKELTRQQKHRQSSQNYRNKKKAYIEFLKSQIEKKKTKACSSCIQKFDALLAFEKQLVIEQQKDTEQNQNENKNSKRGRKRNEGKQKQKLQKESQQRAVIQKQKNKLSTKQSRKNKKSLQETLQLQLKTLTTCIESCESCKSQQKNQPEELKPNQQVQPMSYFQRVKQKQVKSFMSQLIGSILIYFIFLVVFDVSEIQKDQQITSRSRDLQAQDHFANCPAGSNSTLNPNIKKKNTQTAEEKPIEFQNQSQSTLNNLKYQSSLSTQVNKKNATSLNEPLQTQSCRQTRQKLKQILSLIRKFQMEYDQQKQKYCSIKFKYKQVCPFITLKKIRLTAYEYLYKNLTETLCASNKEELSNQQQFYFISIQLSIDNWMNYYFEQIKKTVPQQVFIQHGHQKIQQVIFQALMYNIGLSEKISHSIRNIIQSQSRIDFKQILSAIMGNHAQVKTEQL